MKHTDRIQKYLDGKMDEEELRGFREDLKKDPDLVQELDLHRSLGEIIVSKDEERFRKKLTEAYKAYRVISEPGKRKRSELRKYFKPGIIWIPVPGLVLVLLVLLFFRYHKDSNQVIFTHNFYPYQPEIASREDQMGSSTNLQPSKGLGLYLNGKYLDASSEFLLVLDSIPFQPEALFFNGLCYMHLNEFDNAISSFNLLLNQSFSYHEEYAKWYLALCYIKTNQNDNAKSILISISREEGNYFSSKARKALRKLR